MSKMNFPRVCKDCGQAFVYHGVASLDHGASDLAARCPACLDIKHGRPSIIRECEMVKGFLGVRVDGLPGEWAEVPPHTKRDFVSYVIDVKGSQFGAVWNGRIVIRAPRPIAVGEIVNLRVMRATHEVRAQYNEQGRRQVLPWQSAEGEIEKEEHLYIALDPGHVQPVLLALPQYRLVCAKSHTKTTLKGLGAQYHGAIDATAAKWQKEISGGVRSGREITRLVMAVLPENKKLTVSQTGHSGSGKPDGYNWTMEI